MTDKIRIGLVGLGKIAKDQHLPAIAALPDTELVAVASPGADAIGVANYPDADTMLADGPPIDAVVMCQPPQARFTAAWAAIKAGKHVFLEKPPGATLSEVQALVDLAAERGTTLFTAWHSREAAAVATAKAWLAHRTIRSVRINWKEDVRVWHPGQQWIWQPGGFGVFDPGINALSILTEILPQPLRMLSADLAVPSNRHAPIAAKLAMQLACGAPADADFDFRQTGPQSWDIAVETGDGEVLIQHGGNVLSIAGEPQTLPSENEYPALYRHFVDLIRGGRSDVDLAPLRLVADSFLCGRISLVEPFDD